MEQVTISKEEYEQLLDDSRRLNALYAIGVDNWEGYGELSDYLEELENEE